MDCMTKSLRVPCIAPALQLMMAAVHRYEGYVAQAPSLEVPVSKGVAEKMEGYFLQAIEITACLVPTSRTGAAAGSVLAEHRGLCHGAL
jgi:hypothetical protein